MGSTAETGTDRNPVGDGTWVEDSLASVDLVGEAAALPAADLIGQAVPVAAAAGGGVIELPAGSVAFPSSRSEAPARREQRRPWPIVLTLLTFAVDCAAVMLAYVLARAVVHDNGWDGLGPALFHPIDKAIFATLAVWPVVFALYGLYDLRRPTHATAELQRLFHAVAMCVLVVVLLTFGTRIAISREFIAVLLVFSLLTTVAGRLTMRRISHALNSRTITSQPTLIVGTNDEARAIGRTLRRSRWMGYDVRGFVDTRASALDVVDGLPVFGHVDDIGNISAEHGIHSVIIAGSAAGGETLQLIDSSLAADVTVRVSPGLPNLGASRVVLEPIDGMALFSLRRHRFSRRQRLVKRAVDTTLSVLLLALASPLMAVIAVCIKFNSKGPVLFRQRRVGEDGVAFTMYKFRTMVVDAEQRRHELLATNEADGLLFKMKQDPRVTSVGRFLRKSSLDELPQLINVLKGNMSLVGPRPALPEETSRYAESWSGRLRVKPGLTGLWQVNGRHDLNFDDYLRYDLFYVENWSLTMDLYILAKTLPALLTGRGSY